MLYIICALKPEAQAFVDKYKLSKSKYNSKITIIISGIGKENMFNTTKIIAKKMTKEDIIINVGICAANKNYEIGQLIDGFKENLTCVDKPISDSGIYTLVDMESSGFIDATKKINNKYIFKVVSDYFEPHMVTKEITKKLIFNTIDDINRIIFYKDNN
ncbi:hypothetical protein [Sulfurimonas sp.]|uniref:hypothetical protein n=1 Tax=Sulfurimonas sp. TaxID=2022749 RepID=UPI002B491C3F|nr:hypothetical protein [Sulfurimonas sp.]